MAGGRVFRVPVRLKPANPTAPAVLYCHSPFVKNSPSRRWRRRALIENNILDAGLDRILE
jgi:hypothetical protein